MNKIHQPTGGLKPIKKGTHLYKFLTELLRRNLSTIEAERHVRTTRIANVATHARQLLGITLPCVIHHRFNADGEYKTYGVYRLSTQDRDLVYKALNRGSHEQATQAQ